MSLNYLDMEKQVQPIVSVDEYSSKIGKDSKMVTLAFIVNSEEAGNDLSDWFERGYTYVLDAQISDGELKPGKYLVFVEMKRRPSIPGKIIELLTDLETLTGLSIDDWKVRIDDKTYPADEKVLKEKIILSPSDYEKELGPEEEDSGEGSDEDLNEMRTVAGLAVPQSTQPQDEELRNYKAIAGL